MFLGYNRYFECRRGNEYRHRPILLSEESLREFLAGKRPKEERTV